MFKIYTVSFFGHRIIENTAAAEYKLEEHIKSIIDQKEYVEFLVGRNGDFDRCCAAAVKRVRKNHRDDNSALVLMLPYLTAEYLNNKISFEKYYDSIEVPVSSAQAHPKSAITIRNREMVTRADIIICYIQNEYGGAYQAVRYAQKLGKTIINLAPETQFPLPRGGKLNKKQ